MIMIMIIIIIIMVIKNENKPDHFYLNDLDNANNNF